MDFTPYPIADIRYGKYLRRKPWLAPKDAFKDLVNGYVDKGILKKRNGYTEFGRLCHFVDDEDIGVGNSSNKTFTDTLANTPVMVGSITVTDGVETFTDNGDGTLTGDAGGVGTYVADTGAISVTFHAAPGAVDIHCDYSYYPGYPCMGIFEHFVGSNRYLVAFDTKRMNRYNATTKVFEDVIKTNTWTGDDNDFFHVCSATDDNLYITNNRDQIQKWNGTTLSAFSIDYDTGGNDVTTAKFIFEYWGHLVILAPTEKGNYCPRRWRCSDAGDYSTWASYRYADAPTPDEIMGAKLINGILYVWFKESLWRLIYTGVASLPFEWEQVSPDEGLYGGFSIITGGVQGGSLTH